MKNKNKWKSYERHYDFKSKQRYSSSEFNNSIFLQQKDKSSCALVAIINAKRWQGKKAPANILPALRKEYNFNSKGYYNGLNIGEMKQVMKKEFGRFTSKLKIRPTLKDIDKCLRKNKIANLTYWSDTGKSGHVILCIKQRQSATKKYYEIVGINLPNDKRAIMLMERSEMSRILKNKCIYNGQESEMFEISKPGAKNTKQINWSIFWENSSVRDTIDDFTNKDVSKKELIAFLKQYGDREAVEAIKLNKLKANHIRKLAKRAMKREGIV